MKKLFLLVALLFTCGYLHADQKAELGSVSVLNSATVTISSTTAGRICLTDFSLMSTSASNMVIIDGPLTSGTTIWGILTAPASVPVNVSSAGRDSALCGSLNRPMTINIAAGTPSISYRGFVK